MLSVIVCTYNNLEEAQYTLESLKNQKNQSFETVVIDGGSKSDLVEVLREHADVLVSEPDNGLYHAFNKGARSATQKYIMYMNAGDSLATNSAIDNVLETIYREPDKKIFIFRSNILCRNHTRIFIRPKRHDGLQFCHQAMIIERVLQTRYPFNEKFYIGADTDVWRRMRADQEFEPYLDETVISNFVLGGRSSDMKHNVARGIEKLWSKYQLGEPISDREFLAIYAKSKIGRVMARFPSLIETYYKVKARF